MKFLSSLDGVKNIEALRVRVATSVRIDGECWTWTGKINQSGYGETSVNGKSARAHRVAYLLRFSTIPDGLPLDHLCRNRACVNPDHLEPVPHKENIRRGETGQHFASKTHCPKGHAYDPKNTIVVKTVSGFGRQCRACRKSRLKGTPRGLGSMSREKRGEICSMGGKAAHRLGRAHEFTSEEARSAGTKGGLSISSDREHMSEIGKRGGATSRRNRRND